MADLRVQRGRVHPAAARRAVRPGRRGARGPVRPAQGDGDRRPAALRAAAVHRPGRVGAVAVRRQLPGRLLRHAVDSGQGVRRAQPAAPLRPGGDRQPARPGDDLRHLRGQRRRPVLAGLVHPRGAQPEGRRVQHRHHRGDDHRPALPGLGDPGGHPHPRAVRPARGQPPAARQGTGRARRLRPDVPGGAALRRLHPVDQGTGHRHGGRVRRRRRRGGRGPTLRVQPARR